MTDLSPPEPYNSTKESQLYNNNRYISSEPYIYINGKQILQQLDLSLETLRSRFKILVFRTSKLWKERAKLLSDTSMTLLSELCRRRGQILFAFFFFNFPVHESKKRHIFSAYLYVKSKNLVQKINPI